MREMFIKCFTFLMLVLVAATINLHGRTNTDLPAAKYDYLLLTDTILNLEDTLLFELDNCTFTAEICIGVPIDEISDYQITTNGAAYTNGIAGCDFDTSNFYSYTNLFGQGNLGPYILQSWSINSSVYSAPFSSMQELVDSMNSWDPAGNWLLDTGLQTISGGVPGNSYSNMIIYVLALGTTNTLGHSDNYIPQGTLLFINSGITELVITESISGASDTAYIIASCAQPESINETVLVNASGEFCLDFSELPGDINTVSNNCTSSDIDFQFINSDSCILFTGLAVGLDTACIVACDMFGFCDTTYLMVESVSPLTTQEIFDTLELGETAQWCADLSIFIGTPDTIYNLCPGSSGSVSDFIVDEDNFCVDYTTVGSIGTDQACYVICDDLNNCDTTIISVTTLASGLSFYYDTLYINQLGNFCDWELFNLSGPIENIVNDCPGLSGTSVFYDVDAVNNCINYEALGVGIDTACIYLSDGFGNTDTTIAIVSVLLPVSSTLTDTIRLSTSPTYCIDTTQLAGDIVSIENICPGSSGDALIYTIDTSTFCIQVDPIALGTDSICIVICDEFGVCDSTTLIVTVEEDNINNLPMAVDDIDSTLQNTPFIIDVCINDSFPGNLAMTNFFVLPVSSGGIGPVNGVATSNLDCSISYTPDDEFCGVDQISYVICNQMGCDTALVTVTVICPPSDFEVFNGFSPNGDGVNDFFRINGLDEFPDHILYVYNRWGNQVLKVSDYQNDWDGRWQGLDLPDGTYFYVLDTGTETMNSGYVYITR